jgi:putative acetyltransferase
MYISLETPADLAAIAAINQRAFAGQAHSDQQEHLLVAALRAAGALELSLLAWINGEAVGHIAFSKVTIDEQPGGWYGLAPLAVLPPYHHQGIGAALVLAGLQLLRERGAVGCVVLGEPAYYGRFGFSSNTDLPCALPVPAEYFMVLPLCEQAASAKGTVSFHPLFTPGQ